MLGDDLHGKVVVVDIDVFGGPHPLYKTVLDFETGVVGVVEDAEFRVASLSVKIKTAVLLFVEANTPSNQFPDLFRSAPHHFFDRLAVREPVAGDHSVLDMLVEIVHLEICNRSDSSLGECGVGLLERGLADHSHASAPAGGLEREAHACDSGANHQIIVLINHRNRGKPY